jgi:hypothetical protein
MIWEISGIHTKFFGKSIELCAGKFQESIQNFLERALRYVLENLKDAYTIFGKSVELCAGNFQKSMQNFLERALSYVLENLGNPYRIFLKEH